MKKKFTINESENVMTENTAAEAMEQNLKDAGCDVKTRQKFFALADEGKTAEQLLLLSEQRERLLNRVHKDERRITCLDYLVYQMRKQNGMK